MLSVRELAVGRKRDETFRQWFCEMIGSAQSEKKKSGLEEPARSSWIIGIRRARSGAGQNPASNFACGRPGRALDRGLDQHPGRLRGAAASACARGRWIPRIIPVNTGESTSIAVDLSPARMQEDGGGAWN